MRNLPIVKDLAVDMAPFFDKWRDALNDPLTRLHLYGKAAVQPGRKMGHVTRLLG